MFEPIELHYDGIRHRTTTDDTSSTRYEMANAAWQRIGAGHARGRARVDLGLEEHCTDTAGFTDHVSRCRTFLNSDSLPASAI